VEKVNAWPDGVDVEKLADAVAISSARVYRRYPNLKAIDDQDVAQELWLFAWKKRLKIQEYMDREDRKSIRKGWSALLTMMDRAAERYCQKQKAKEGGYEIQDLVFYTPDSIKDWLAVLVHGSGVLTNQADEEVRHTRLANEAYNLEATVADIQSALGKLDVLDQYILLEHYGHMTSRRKIAEVLDISESTLARRLDDGLKQMVNHLGGQRPW
jgi:DNA-directed RNA polymerase specialized sigma24 family protein